MCAMLLMLNDDFAIIEVAAHQGGPHLFFHARMVVMYRYLKFEAE